MKRIFLTADLFIVLTIALLGAWWLLVPDARGQAPLGFWAGAGPLALVGAALPVAALAARFLPRLPAKGFLHQTTVVLCITLTLAQGAAVASKIGSARDHRVARAAFVERFERAEFERERLAAKLRGEARRIATEREQVREKIAGLEETLGSLDGAQAQAAEERVRALTALEERLMSQEETVAGLIAEAEAPVETRVGPTAEDKLALTHAFDRDPTLRAPVESIPPSTTGPTSTDDGAPSSDDPPTTTTGGDDGDLLPDTGKDPQTGSGDAGLLQMVMAAIAFFLAPELGPVVATMMTGALQREVREGRITTAQAQKVKDAMLKALTDLRSHARSEVRDRLVVLGLTPAEAEQVIAAYEKRHPEVRGGGTVVLSEACEAQLEEARADGLTQSEKDLLLRTCPDIDPSLLLN